MKTNKIILLAALACAAACAAAIAQQKVAGEKWRMKMSMQAEGFTMPARTTEMCLPQGRPEQAMLDRQSSEGNCAVSNFRQTGNKTSADIKCTGKDKMEGHIEMEQLAPNSVRGSMSGKTADASMKMDYEYTKIGGACETTDYSNYKPPATVNIPQVDYCQKVFDGLEKGNLSNVAVAAVQSYPKADGSGMQTCTTHAGFQKFCAAVQTPAGFADLEHEQWQRRTVPAGRNEETYARMARTPLTESMQLCKLGTGDAAVVKLQKQMAATARQEGKYGFVLYYDAVEQYPALQELAKKECSGRSFTNAANKQYLPLCASYGAMLARNDRAGVLGAAGCSKEREDTARGICVGATAEGTGSMAAMGGTASGAGAATPAAAEAAPATAKDKAKDAVDKGKKALRGLFGGG